jgi:hypothetical protein
MVMAILQSIDINAVDSRKFSYHATKKTFFAEASDLYGHNLYQQVYDDAIDVGFAIRNYASGNIKRFYMATAHKDREGDITHWTFKLIAEDARKNPELKDLSVVIFND